MDNLMDNKMNNLMDNKILNTRMTNSQPEPRAVAIIW